MMDSNHVEPPFFVNHMLNEESNDKYDVSPFIIFVLALIVGHLLDKKEVPHNLHPLSWFNSFWQINQSTISGCARGEDEHWRGGEGG